MARHMRKPRRSRAAPQATTAQRHPTAMRFQRSARGLMAQAAAKKGTTTTILSSRLSLTNLSERDRTLVTLLIESLDEDGYLTQDLPELQAMLPEELGVELEELQIALKHLHHFEPTGVGARNLGECLALQLVA